MVLFRRDEGHWNPHRAAARSGLIGLFCALSLSVAAQTPQGPKGGANGHDGASAGQRPPQTAPGAPAQPHAATKEDNASNRFNGPQPTDTPKLTDWIVAGAAVINLLFSGGLVVSTIWLWRETRRLAKGAEEQAKDFKSSLAHAEASAGAAAANAEAAASQAKAMVADLRPWLAVEKATILHDIIIRSHCLFDFELTVRNVGRSPAIGVIFVPIISLSVIPEPADLAIAREGKFPEDEMVEVVIFPGQEYKYQKSEIIGRGSIEDAGRKFTAERSDDRLLLPISLCGFVGYKSPLDGSIYRTGFGYYMNSTDDGGRLFDSKADIVTFSKAKLYLNIWFQGWYAT